MFKWLFLLFLTICLIPVTLIGLSLDEKPLIEEDIKVKPGDAAKAKQLASKLKKAYTSDKTEHRIVAKMSEISSAGRFATRVIPRTRFKASNVNAKKGVDQGSLELAVSLKLSPDLWSNMALVVEGSNTGFEITTLRVGQTAVPAGPLLPLVEMVLNAALGDNLGTMVIKSTKDLTIRNDRVYLSFGITEAEKKTLVDRSKKLIRSAGGVVPPEKIASYWQEMDKASRTGELKASRSMADYARFTLKMAADRNEKPDAALLAFAAHCGHARIEELVGRFRTEAERQRKSRCLSATLGKRTDLRQHFALSAGLEVLSDSGLAFAIGEFKELLDANKGGSGFSFDDIAADRAGIYFAQKMRTLDSQNLSTAARKIKTEMAIMPKFSDLPSFMNKSEFTRKFGSPESDRYKKMIDKIDQRIEGLALY